MCRESDGVIWASLALAPRGYPPRLPGLGACRSFVVDMAADALAQAIETAGFVPGRHPSAWREPASSGDAATLLLQPMNAATTCAHLFITEGLGAARRLAAAQRMKAVFTKELAHV